MNCRRKPEHTLKFEDAAHFNRALDTDEALQDGMAELAEPMPMRQVLDAVQALAAQWGAEA